jgi:hypothetical protein
MVWTMSGWSAVSCLVAVTSLSHRSTRFRVTVDSIITIITVIIFILILIYVSNMFQMVNNPITGLDRPWEFQEIEAPRFQDNRHMKVVRLSALLIGLLCPPQNITGTHFCEKMSQLQGHSAAGRIMSMENSNDTIGNRTSDLEACSAVPQSTAPPRVPMFHTSYGLNYWADLCFNINHKSNCCWMLFCVVSMCLCNLCCNYFALDLCLVIVLLI